MRLNKLLNVYTLVAAVFYLAIPIPANADSPDPLPGTAKLEARGDLGMQMVEGIDKFLLRETAASVGKRAAYWNRDLSSHEAYTKSVEPNRQHLAHIVGVIDARNPANMEIVSAPGQPQVIVETDLYRVYVVRWRVFRGVDGEGLLLEPTEPAVANVVALPDCDATPEDIAGLTDRIPAPEQFARRLAENRCRVLVLALLNRRDTYAGNPAIRMTNQPHREFIWRGAYELGRTMSGYEIQKTLAAVDWFTTKDASLPVAVMGYGEGGLAAFYTAALDTRIRAAVVSGYFMPREDLWTEPVYRSTWALLHEFGDAEIASLVIPRTLIIEASDQPSITAPPPKTETRRGAAPGIIATPPLETVKNEVERANARVAALQPPAPVRLIDATGHGPAQDETLKSLLATLGVDFKQLDALPALRTVSPLPDNGARTKRQFTQYVEDLQKLMYASEDVRAAFWAKADATSIETWVESTKWYRTYFREEVIGELPKPTIPMNPRARLIYDTPKFRGYEIMLDVYPDVFDYGILLVPKDLKDGEQRPVVVCQHGLEGRSQDVANPDVDSDYYHRFACQLADQGFITYAPQNPYVGEDLFREVQRKANPLKLSLFSFITRQHERHIEWLSQLPFVDPKRIAFYGLSYGGKTALRVPAQLDGYCLSICAGDYNEWIWKMVSTTAPFSYMFTREYEMYEFDMANTFNHAEMTWLILPRPFMVERGRHDGVGIDPWVAYEYEQTRRRYDLLGLGDRTTIEYFNGPHTIHGVGTFEFLHKQLQWP